jgi:hypothetical protein
MRPKRVRVRSPYLPWFRTLPTALLIGRRYVTHRATSSAAAGGLILMSWLGVAVLGDAPSAGSATTAPSYSATGVCVSGIPQLAFSFTGFPVGQSTRVNVDIYDGPDSTGMEETIVGPSGMATAVWDIGNSPDFGPGSHVIAAYLASSSSVPGQNVSGLPAQNLTPVPNWPLADAYNVTLPHCGAAPFSFVGLASTPDGQGYWQATSDGQVLAFGNARWFGSMSGSPLNHPVVGIASTPTGNGYWLVASDGGVFSFGDAQFYGSTGGIALNRPIVGIASTRDGGGYYLVASDGGVFSFGDARFLGSMGGTRINQPVVGMSVDPSTGGYWLVAADGGVFSYGAPFLGSTGSIHLNRPVVGMETGTGTGYRFVANDGGVFTFGTSTFFGSLGSMPPPHAVVGIAPSVDDQGYTILDSAGGIYPFGNASNFGSIYGAVTLP